MEAEKNINVVLERENLEKEVTTPFQKESPIQKFTYFLIFLIVFSVVLGGAAFGYIRYKKIQTTPVVTKPSDVVITAKKADYLPLTLPQGTQTYRYSHGKDVVGPLPQVVELSTIDPGLGGKQTVKVTITHNSPITDVSVNLKTDNKIVNHSLKKISGTNFDGIWEGSWEVDDTYKSRWFLEFDLKSATTSYKDGLAFR